MDIQTVIVTLIVLAALLYVGQLIWLKLRSASKKSSCAVDCGCESKSKTSGIS